MTVSLNLDAERLKGSPGPGLAFNLFSIHSTLNTMPHYDVEMQLLQPAHVQSNVRPAKPASSSGQPDDTLPPSYAAATSSANAPNVSRVRPRVRPSPNRQSAPVGPRAQFHRYLYTFLWFLILSPLFIMAFVTIWKAADTEWTTFAAKRCRKQDGHVETCEKQHHAAVAATVALGVALSFLSIRHLAEMDKGRLLHIACQVIPLGAFGICAVVLPWDNVFQQCFWGVIAAYGGHLLGLFGNFLFHRGLGPRRTGSTI